MWFYADRDVESQLGLLLNRGLTFHDNMDAAPIELVTTGGTETIYHNLGRIPVGWLIVYIECTANEPIFLYAEAPSTWTKELMYLRSSVANVTVRLFVL